MLQTSNFVMPNDFQENFGNTDNFMREFQAVLNLHNLFFRDGRGGIVLLLLFH